MAEESGSIGMRFRALESWRGLSACFVILYHFNAASHFSGGSLLRHAYLFVDFFFVLSGFVIFESYYRRILSGFPVERFMMLRLGRLYPLHLLTLAALMVYLSIRAYLAPADGTMPPPALIGIVDNPSVVSHLTFLNAMGLQENLSWNLPAWSIGAEFYTYIAFALIILLFRELTASVALVVIFGALMVLLLSDHSTINISYDLGFVRCLYGFGIGAFLSLMRPDAGFFSRRPRRYATEAEIAAVALVFVFVCTAGSATLSFAAPVYFAVIVAVFAEERGRISQWLSRRPLVWLGERSYSIYMLQFLCVVVTMDVLWAIDRLSGTSIHAALTGRAPTDLWMGDLATIGIIALIVGVSALTFRFIERPTRVWVRHIAAAMPALGSGRSGLPSERAPGSPNNHLVND